MTIFLVIVVIEIGFGLWIFRANLRLVRMKKILEILQKSDESVSISQLLEETGYSEDQMADVLRTLQRDKRVAIEVVDFEVYYVITDKGREWISYK